VGLVTRVSVTKAYLDSFHSKVFNYQVFSNSAVSRKRKFNVVKTKPVTAVEGALLVVGGRIPGSCGAAYLHVNGKVVAFQKESVDDGREEVSVSNSYHSDRSHTSCSTGLGLCRLPRFKDWYDNSISRTVS
jgi:hypothetical protein